MSTIRVNSHKWPHKIRFRCMCGGCKRGMGSHGRYTIYNFSVVFPFYTSGMVSCAAREHLEASRYQQYVLTPKNDLTTRVWGVYWEWKRWVRIRCGVWKEVFSVFFSHRLLVVGVCKINWCLAFCWCLFSLHFLMLITHYMTLDVCVCVCARACACVYV